jgi:hypothetical protein
MSTPKSWIVLTESMEFPVGVLFLGSNVLFKMWVGCSRRTEPRWVRSCVSLIPPPVPRTPPAHLQRPAENGLHEPLGGAVPLG